jgi:hypothetical protein
MLFWFISLGSIIADVEVHGTKTDTNDLERDVAISGMKMLSGKRTLNVNGQDLHVQEIIPKHDNGTLGKRKLDRISNFPKHFL